MAKRNPERDILAAARDYGYLGFMDGAHSEGSERLFDLYPEDSQRFDSELNICFEFLAESRYLWPMFNSEGVRIVMCARGITPKGQQRLYELEHPIRAWLKVHWFPTSIAFATNLTAIASVVVRFVI